MSRVVPHGDYVRALQYNVRSSASSYMTSLQAPPSRRRSERPSPVPRKSLTRFYGYEKGSRTSARDYWTPPYGDNSAVICSLILRIRGLFLARCIIRGEGYTNVELKAYAREKGMDETCLNRIRATRGRCRRTGYRSNSGEKNQWLIDYYTKGIRHFHEEKEKRKKIPDK